MPLEHHLTVALPGARALFTTAAAGDLALEQTANRERLAAELALDFAWPKQVHGSTVHHADAPGFVGEGDGVLTATPGIGVIVLAADCVPVVISDGQRVAAVHAGWHGLDEGVIARAVTALRRGTAAAGMELGGGGPLSAAIGPAAGVCCYEVGDELRDRFVTYDAERGRNLDLKLIARRQLEQAGVSEIHDVGICTICSAPDQLFSHRRDAGKTGRQVGIGWLVA